MTQSLPTATLDLRGAPASYLFVIDDGGSRKVPLQPTGVTTVGRAEDRDIVLDDSSASRNHAELRAEASELVVVDLGSRHGTRVNGRLVRGQTQLATGDVIELGRSTLVVHIPPVRLLADVLERGPLLNRLERELDRAKRHRRTLVLLRIDHAGAAAASVLAQVRMHLGGDAAVGLLDDQVVLVILTDVTPADAQLRAAAIDAALVATAPGIHSVVACFPGDATNLGGLLAAARARSSGAAERVQIGDRTALVGDPAMIETYALLRRLASSDLAVLVVGETGVGKEMAAHALHTWSRRSEGRFVAVNCAALPETLIESELFGYERGAFSGADRMKRGLIELAAGGTLFLDEVVELPLPAQAKLLRALEQRTVVRVGGLEPIHVDFRLVAATNGDVSAQLASGRLRGDLYYRIAATVVEIPPLRDRPRDLAMLAQEFLARAAVPLARGAMTLSDDALRVLGDYRFPGNVRELINAIDYAVAACSDTVIEPWHLPAAISAPPRHEPAAREPGSFRPLDEEVAELETRRMVEALAAAQGNQTRAADLIGMPRRTFVKKLTRYGLRPSGSDR